MSVRFVGLMFAAFVLAACAGGSDAVVASTSEPDGADIDVVDSVATTAAVSAPTEVVVPTTPLPTGVPELDDLAVEAEQTPPTLQVGSEGTTVHDTQDLLNDYIGYADVPLERIVEDGFYGPNTEEAQRSFETYAGLVVDGVASIDDRGQLELAVAKLESDSADSAVSLGDQSTFVGTWQSRLNTWHTLALETSELIVVDDRFGEDTEQATLAAEDALGLQVDGIVEAEDRAALRAAIAALRAETYLRVLHQTSRGDTQIIVKSFYANNQYCLRFIVGLAADERCTKSAGGDINTAYFVTVNGVSFVAGTANPNVSFVQLTTNGLATPVATRQIGNSIARAWVEVVDNEPDKVELLEADGSSVLELRFSIAPTERDFFGSTIAIQSPNFTQVFFVDECTRTEPNDLAVEGSLANATLNVTVVDGTGTLTINSGTASLPITISGVITNATVQGPIFTITGTFNDELLDEAAFTATGSC